MSFTLAILGRPNVGKSTLFNRLVGKRLAIVDDTPGVTRDRREGLGRLSDLRFKLFDTAGLEEGDAESLSGRMRAQTQSGLDEADVALMVYDARLGVTPVDEHFAAWLRRGDTPVILIANKCESNKSIDGIYESFGLGLGEPIVFSAEHGQGLAELYGAIVEKLREIGIDPYAEEEEEARRKKSVEDEDLQEGDLEFDFEEKEEDEDPTKHMRLQDQKQV